MEVIVLRGLWMVTLLVACTGGTSATGSTKESAAEATPGASEPEAAESSPQASARTASQALPAAAATVALPDDVLRVDFGAEGLRVIRPGSEPELVAPAVGEGRAMHPETMAEYGSKLPALATWLTANLPASQPPEQVAVAVPGELPYSVAKAIFRELHHAGARQAHAVVRTPDGTEAALPIAYPETYPPGQPVPPTLRLLLSPEGATVEGLGKAAVADRRTYDCDPPCTTPDTWPRRDVGRMVLRAHVKNGMDHLTIIPHSDVRWDVIVDMLDLTRTDARLDGQGEPMFSDQRIAGMRRLEPTAQEMMRDAAMRAQQEQAKEKEEAAGEGARGR